MPYVEGESLRDRLSREKQLPLDEALQIGRQVAVALCHSPSADVIHREVKPENVLLEAGHAVVSDFGIARAITVAGTEKLTETGIALGTPAYMSPEQGAGRGVVDGRSDIYSLGCVLYEMLAGEPPFGGPTGQAILARHSLDPVPRLKTVRATVPEGVEWAITKALAKVPADRFPTAAQFADALRAPIQLATRASKRRWARTAVRVAIGLALLVSAAWTIAQWRSRPPAPISPTRIAVLPFAVRGSGSFAYLAEGLVELLSRNLDGAEDLRSVDPGTVFTTVARRGGSAGPARTTSTRRLPVSRAPSPWTRVSLWPITASQSRRAGRGGWASLGRPLSERSAWRRA